MLLVAAAPGGVALMRVDVGVDVTVAVAVAVAVTDGVALAAAAVVAAAAVGDAAATNAAVSLPAPLAGDTEGPSTPSAPTRGNMTTRVLTSMPFSAGKADPPPCHSANSTMTSAVPSSNSTV